MSEGEVEEEGPAGEDGEGEEADGEEDVGEGEGALDDEAEDAGESHRRGGVSLAQSSGLELTSELGVGEAVVAVEATSSSTDGVTSATDGEQ